MPNRFIKESICTSDSIDGLSWFDEVFFYRLTVNADDYGRFDARTAILKARLFPLKNISDKQIEQTLASLEQADLIHLYESEGKPYLHLPTWGKHQSVRNTKSKYPSPVEGEPQALECNCKQLKANVPVSVSVSVSVSESVIRESKGADAPAHTKHGQYGWVKLTDEEHTKLTADLGEQELARCIAYVDESAQGTGNKNKWKDWNLVIRKCSREKWGVKGADTGKRVNFQLYDQTQETAQPEGMPDLLAEARAWAAEQKEVAL